MFSPRTFYRLDYSSTIKVDENKPKMLEASKCCCCIDLRSGGVIIGYLGLVLTISNIIIRAGEIWTLLFSSTFFIRFFKCFSNPTNHGWWIEHFEFCSDVTVVNRRKVESLKHFEYGTSIFSIYPPCFLLLLWVRIHMTWEMIFCWFFKFFQFQTSCYLSWCYMGFTR